MAADEFLHVLAAVRQVRRHDDDRAAARCLLPGQRHEDHGEPAQRAPAAGQDQRRLRHAGRGGLVGCSEAHARLINYNEKEVRLLG